MQLHRVEAFIALERAAFMTFKQELWNPDRTRLMLLMDPGRIKRGVATNMELGQALEMGEQYAILVGAGWPGAAGQKLTPEFRSAFHVGNALRARPEISDWAISLPQIGTLQPLVIRFDRPYDRFKLTQAIALRNAAGQRLSGSVDVRANEMTWQFVPDEPWVDPQVTVVIDAVPEDVAGNNFREVLDHAVGTRSRKADHVTPKVTLSD